MAKSQNKKEKQETKGPPEGRRYVGTAETVGFIMYDAAPSIVIGPNAEWTDRLLNISKGVQALLGPFGTVWDVLDDLFVAAWVEKTRTRFGKFRPYLLLYPLYGLPMTLLVYMLPYIFWGTDSTFVPKIAFNFALGLLNELTGTISQIARMGMVANITPEPQERLSLITKAKFLSFGSSLPKQIFTILRDIISRNTKKTALEVNMNLRSLYTWMGMITMTISAGISLYYVIVTRERVQSAGTAELAVEDKPPTFKESLVALKNNRPLLLFMLSQVLDGFQIGRQHGTYVDSILNFSNFGLISGIPGSPVSYASYGYITWLRQRFSTKTLWIASENINKPFWIGIYFFGMLRTKKAAQGNGFHRMYAHLVPMLIAYSIENTAYMALYGAKRVIPDEIRNEMIDYGEWKNGFRGEAMVGMMRGLPQKIAGAVGSTLTNAIMQMIGFQTGEHYLHQTEKTADGIFAMATIVPAFLGSIGLIPKFFYNIDQKTREVMYADLAVRRAAAAAAHNQVQEVS